MDVRKQSSMYIFKIHEINDDMMMIERKAIERKPQQQQDLIANYI